MEDGVTGLVADPVPEALAAQIARLHADQALCRRLGQAGRDAVRDIRWATTIDRLLAG